MNRFCRKGLSFALMGTFSSGFIGNNIACARSTADVAGLHVSLPDAFGNIDHTLASRKDSDGKEFTLVISPTNERLELVEHSNHEVSFRRKHKDWFSQGDHHKFIGGRDIDELLAKLKTILKEASELNDCDEDMGKIRDLRSKFIEISKQFGEKNIDDYIRRHKNEKKVVMGILFLSILALLIKIYYDTEAKGTKNEKQTCEGGEMSEQNKSWYYNYYVPKHTPEYVNDPNVAKYLTEENVELCKLKLSQQN